MSFSRQLACVIAVAVCSTAQAETIYVDVNCPGPGSGSERAPYCAIQTAIDNAVETDEIVVAPGTYFETINFLGKAITLRSSDGPVIIDGTGFFHVVKCVSGEGLDTILDGFTITGGNADGDDYPDYLGGGMVNDNSSPTVTNCTFSGNSAARLAFEYHRGHEATAADGDFGDARWPCVRRRGIRDPHQR